MAAFRIVTKLMGRGLEISTVDLTPDSSPKERTKQTKLGGFTYESLVFHRQTGEEEWDGAKYKTEREARTGHTALVKKWKAVSRKEVRETLDRIKGPARSHR